MPRGIKTCNKCGKTTGPRTRECANCGQSFMFKPKAFNKEPEKQIDWRMLKRGDRIRTIMGSGPYCLNSNGDRAYIGHYGKFIVLEVKDNGLEVISDGVKGIGYAFIYMGEESRSADGIIYRQPHKIKKLRPRIIK